MSYDVKIFPHFKSGIKTWNLQVFNGTNCVVWYEEFSDSDSARIYAERAIQDHKRRKIIAYTVD